MYKGIIILIVLIGLGSCQDQPVFDEPLEREKILALHHAQRKNHFEKDSVAAARQLSDQFIAVNRGKISQPSYQDNLQRYNRYFSTVKFVKWDDLAEPIIRFSADGKMAYTVVDKEVIIRYANEEGDPVADYEEEETTHFSWVTIYRKYPEGWKIDCVASTNEPSIVKRVVEDE